jgi:hypothetical protein
MRSKWLSTKSHPSRSSTSNLPGWDSDYPRIELTLSQRIADLRVQTALESWAPHHALYLLLEAWLGKGKYTESIPAQDWLQAA